MIREKSGGGTQVGKRVGKRRQAGVLGSRRRKRSMAGWVRERQGIVRDSVAAAAVVVVVRCCC